MLLCAPVISSFTYTFYFSSLFVWILALPVVELLLMVTIVNLGRELKSNYARFLKRWKGNPQVSVLQLFDKLGPGRPSAGGPRMDRRAVTSLGVVKISRLASRT